MVWAPPIKNTGYTYDLLPSAIHHIVNFSLSRGYFSDILKKACVPPLTKNENLDNNNVKNIRLVNNLRFLGKIIKKCVFLYYISM